MSENTMTLAGLVTKWRGKADAARVRFHETMDFDLDECADELQAYIDAHLSRPVSVSDEDVNRAIDAYERAPGVMQDKAMRAALEADRAGRGAVVPDAKPITYPVSTHAEVDENIYARGWNACREAMLSAAPNHPTTEKG